MKDFISHEIGTHILSNTPMEVLNKLKPKNQEEFQKIFFAYEVLSMFYNKKVLRKKKLGYSLPQFNDIKLIQLYEKYYDKDMSPFDLIEKVYFYPD